MRGVARLGSLWRGLFGRSRMRADLDDELASCVEELAARKQADGLSRSEALCAARREMGSLPHLKMAVRESWVVSSWDAAAQDVRQAWRGLRSTPGPSLLAVATFALGIGSTAAILAVVRGTLFSTLPYREPSRLVLVWADLTTEGHPRAPLSPPELRDLRERTSSFEAFGAVWANSVTLGEQGDPEFVRVGLVTPDLLDLFGVEPAAGRLFVAADDVQGSATIILGHGLWRRRFGGDPGVVGRAITVDGHPAIVIGVLPASFRLLLPPDAGTPDTIEAYRLLGPRLLNAPRGQRFLRVLGRMKPGTSLEQARQDLGRLSAQLAQEFPSPSPTPFVGVSLEADNLKAVRGPVFLVTASVALLLVIAAVNVLGVLVARAAARRREIAVRVALGAGLGRILRLSLAEGVTLAALGAAVGLAVAQAELSVLLALQPATLRRLGSVALDLRVLAWTCGIAFVWAGLFALAPLREFARDDVSGALGSVRGERGRLKPRLRSGLVVAQVALTVVLLVGAGLLTRTFANVLSIDPGFRADGVLTFRVPAATARHTTLEARNALGRAVAERLRAIPGAVSVGAASHLPFDAIPNWGGPYSLEENPQGPVPGADYRAVGPGFFEAAGVTLLEGRAFTESDGPPSQPVAIVDERLAGKAWPNRSPLGQRLRVDPHSNGTPDTWVTVVGVARHVRHRDLLRPLNEQVYFPLSQTFRNPVSYLIRTDGDPASLAPAVREAVRSVEPTLPVYETLPLSDYLERARSVQRFAMVLVLAFACAALVLAAIGVYGVIAYTVVQRRREFGVRMALGATGGQIGALVLRDGARLAVLGIALGLAGALLAGGLIRSQLFGVSANDALTYAVVAPLLGLTALFACWWPARRATSVDVLEVLRAE
jgi:predicted permease